MEPPATNLVFEIALAIVLKDRKVLICQRLAKAHLGTLWEFPGGKIEPSEQPAPCALRELREETGVEARIIAPWPVVEFNYPDRTVRLHPFLCRHVGGEAHPIACRTPTWVNVDQLDHYPFPTANDSLLRRLKQINLPA